MTLTAISPRFAIRTLENTTYLRLMDTARAKAQLSGTRFADFRWTAETGSTNSDALAALGAGATDVVIGSDHQSAGRGRLDRSWESPVGASILMTLGTTRVEVEPTRHLLVTAAALAAIDACEQVTGFRPGLKWPNDLVAVGAGQGGGDLKLAGVLAEVHDLGDGRQGTVVGIGLNCNWSDVGIPEELEGIATSLDLVTGSPVDREALCVAIVREAEDRFEALAAPGGTESTVGGAREESATLGCEVRVELPGEELTGRAVDLDEVGALVVETSEGTRRSVVAGDVIHLRPS
jgi:BirA family biotin operon repressor/biotin-[acetyl-CoA-carboxylase] ligase